MTNSVASPLPEILKHKLSAAQLAPLFPEAGLSRHVPDAVLLPGQHARVYLSKRTDPAFMARRDDLPAANSRVVSGAPMRDLPADTDGCVTVTLDGCQVHLPAHAADQLLFEDQATALCEQLAEAIRVEPELRAFLAPLRIVMEQFDIPLGVADHGPESHCFYAPDAPGKDRIEKAVTAAWTFRVEHLSARSRTNSAGNRRARPGRDFFFTIDHIGETQH